MFADISKTNLGTFGTILVAVIIVDLIVLFLMKLGPNPFGKELNVWYNKFGLNAVIADVLSITLGFLIAQYIYRAAIFPRYGWSLPLFLGVLLAVQIIHDLFFNFGVIQTIPQGHNDMIDVFKSYAVENSAKILIADASMMIGSALIASTLYSYPTPVTIFAGALAVYTVPYILTTQNEYSDYK